MKKIRRPRLFLAVFCGLLVCVCFFFLFLSNLFLNLESTGGEEGTSKVFGPAPPPYSSSPPFSSPSPKTPPPSFPLSPPWSPPADVRLRSPVHSLTPRSFLYCLIPCFSFSLSLRSIDSFASPHLLPYIA